jgi:predicted SprT family Zn-dependent metalloprotease
MVEDGDYDSPGELRTWAMGYARDVVETYEMDVKLESITWTISKRAKRQAGSVRNNSPPGASVGVPVDWEETDDSYRDVTLTLAWKAYKELGLEEMKGTIRHELVHVEQVHRYGKSNHQARFKQRANDLDAPTDCPPFTPAKYVLRCSECDDVVARRYRRSKTVKHPRLYRSRCCKETLVVEDGPA